ncbi:PREDICTED: uncharacterized protein LOC108565084 [Nicrophorus vespilloides]|uniref:Uncharacterized protein LOC108565084 n=1 Tax=Nicrophorus vespilloides TaxID=110193 RepID=A0ABM1MZ55_NICVS|nr:PREDICTED: uncharacterized protein LOC108565084 [Nicrophorus vespilloides]
MNSSIILILGVMAAVAKGQLYSHVITVGAGHGFASPGVVYNPAAADPRHLAHKAVVENAAVEAQLPHELINPFYKNPRIAAGLAKESWFGDKEFPVFNRQADKIPREEIAKIVRRIQHQRR